jgi:hypothetical protein
LLGGTTFLVRSLSCWGGTTEKKKDPAVVFDARTCFFTHGANDRMLLLALEPETDF